MAARLHLHYTLSRSLLDASSEPQMLYALLRVIPEGLASQTSRIPLNLCLAIDRSASMRGERLTEVQEAACAIIDRLGPDDYFSLVVFNDRAKVVAPSRRVTDRQLLLRIIHALQAGGGTSMADALALSAQELYRPVAPGLIGRLLLLTDGRTYGDEQRCISVAQRLQERGVGISALGVGSEWNEDLLDLMTAGPNSHARYISSAREIPAVFANEIDRLQTTVARRVRLDLSARPGARVRTLDRVFPSLMPITLQTQGEHGALTVLGDWYGSEAQLFLAELVVPPLGPGEYPLLKFILRYELVEVAGVSQSDEQVLRVGILPAGQANDIVDGDVALWLERLVAYRLQSQAWRDLASGHVTQATQRLRMAETRLMAVGEADLAHAVREEATRLLVEGSVSDEGRKRIHYGTSGLMDATSMQPIALPL